jgi:prepilin-type processing-associated H-X9-DG protein/prepilin-type N-terminal cleavage/methylation domain-containing protein
VLAAPTKADDKRPNERLFPVFRQAPSGFTALEMLVTVSVLLLLATLLAVAVTSASRKAQTTQCSNNLKQHGIALHSFLADHSVYPLVLNPGWKLGVDVDHYSSIWGALAKHGLAPMTEGKNSVHSCPSAVKQKIPPEGDQNRPVIGYAYNVFGMGKRLEDEPLGLAGMNKAEQVFVIPVPESAVLNPSEMVAMGDGVRGWNQTYEDGVGFISRTPDAKEWPGSHSRVHGRHTGKLVILFADGHVSSLKLNRLFEHQDDAALRMWNRDNQPHRERLK